jgi:hypothetical protein
MALMPEVTLGNIQILISWLCSTEIRSEMQEIDKLAELKTDILLDSDVYISTNPVSIDKINNSDFTFYKNIQKEGIII